MQDTATIARELLGSVFVTILSQNSLLSGIIVETEAYLHQGDEASYSASGKTKHNSSMFEAGGLNYVYKSYGIHYCINVVTEVEGISSVVLLRALMLIACIYEMNKFRDKNVQNIYYLEVRAIWREHLI